MSVAYDLARFVLEFMSTVKSGDIEWQRKKLEEIAELKKQKRVYDTQIEHEIDLLKIKFSEEINRAKDTEARITQDYKEFLDSVDEMKIKILETFPEMPKPMAHIIHHHAKQLIDDLWKNSDESSQRICKNRIAEFLTVVYDDTAQVLLEDNQLKIPAKTLELIKGS